MIPLHAYSCCCYDCTPGFPAEPPRVSRTALRFTGRWNPKPLWKRALMQRGTCVIGRLVAK